MKQSSTDNFTKLSNQLLESNKFTGNEKILLSWIIGWQDSDLDCTASNTYIAKKLGITIKVLNKLITNLNKHSFFSSERKIKTTDSGNYYNSKIMYVNVEELNDYISNEKKGCNPAPVEEPNPPIALTPLPTIDVVEEELICEVITDGIEDFIPKVIECITPTDTKELNPLKITIDDIEEYLIDNGVIMDDADLRYFKEMMKYQIPIWEKELKDYKYITNFIDRISYQFNKNI